MVYKWDKCKGFSGGWAKFAKVHDLQVGDTLELSLVSNDPIKIMISVTKGTLQSFSVSDHLSAARCLSPLLHFSMRHTCFISPLTSLSALLFVVHWCIAIVALFACVCASCCRSPCLSPSLAFSHAAQHLVVSNTLTFAGAFECLILTHTVIHHFSLALHLRRRWAKLRACH